MGVFEPFSSDSEEGSESLVPIDNEMSVREEPLSPEESKGVNSIHHIILYSFIISTTLDGLVQFFFPLATNSDNRALTTLLRSTGIYSLSVTILSAGIIRSRNGDTSIDLLSILLFAMCFHCTTSLGNLAFYLSSHGIRAIDAYEWLNLVFYISFLIVLSRSQGRYMMVRRVLTATGMRS